MIAGSSSCIAPYWVMMIVILEDLFRSGGASRDYYLSTVGSQSNAPFALLGREGAMDMDGSWQVVAAYLFTYFASFFFFFFSFFRKTFRSAES